MGDGRPESGRGMFSRGLGSGRGKRGRRAGAAVRLSSRRLALAGVCVSVVGAAIAPSAANALVAPAQDPFYRPPANLAQYPHGAILRERQVAISGAAQSQTAAAYQLLYRTTNATGQPVASATTIMIPTSPAAGPRRLASYQTFYDSLTLNCAPSYTLQGGNNGGGTNGPTEQTLMSQLLQQGWDVVTADYEGPQNEWAVGPMLGLATLDSIRAVEHFAPAHLEGNRTEVTLNGYSGGSEASTWAAALAPSYTPELDVVGVAAGGEFPDLDYTMARFDGSAWYGTEIGVMEAFSRAYSQFNLKKLLNPTGQQLAAQDGQDASGCAGSTLNKVFGNASQYTNFPSSQALAADPVVKSVLDRISLKNAPRPKAPELLYNAVTDELAFIAPVDALVTDYCDHGVTVDYDRDPSGLEHVSGIYKYWPVALQYLQNAFAGDKPPNNCNTWANPLAGANGL